MTRRIVIVAVSLILIACSVLPVALNQTDSPAPESSNEIIAGDGMGTDPFCPTCEVCPTCEAPGGTVTPVSPTATNTTVPTATATIAPTATSVPANWVNVATGKPVTQSSTDWGGLAPRAVDGNLSGVYEDASITHTREEYRPWWTVDLGRGYEIGSIQLWNRINLCCIDRLADFYVFVSDVPFVSGDLNAVLNQSGVWSQHIPGIAAQTTTINVGRSGRYVRVQLNGTNSLSLAEVQVFAVTQPTATPSLVPTKSSKPYSLQPNTPVYQANFAQSSVGCDWMGVVGQAFDLNGNPVKNLVLVVEGTLTNIPVESLGVTGVNLPYGPSGYEIVLSRKPLDSVGTLHITLYDLAGNPLSDPVGFNTYGTCDKNLVIINFKQTAP